MSATPGARRAVPHALRRPERRVRLAVAVALWLGFLALLGGVVLGGAEVGLRLRRDRQAATVVDYPVADARLVADPLLRYRLAASYSSGSPAPTGEVLAYTHNALGYRGAEITRQKPPGVRRVVVAGGSTVYGALIDDADTLPVQLERALQARLGPADPVQVVNAGVPGFYAVGEALLTKAYLADLQPDVVVVLDGLNDVFYGVNPDWPSQIAEDELRVVRDGRFPEMVAAIDGSMFPLGLVEHQGRMVLRTALQRLAWRLGRPWFAERRAASDRVVALHAAATGLLARYARQAGAAAVTSLQPLLATGAKRLTPAGEEAVGREEYWDVGSWGPEARLMYPAMAECAARETAREGGAFVDLRAAFDAETGTTYAADVAHYTPLGNRLLAERLAPAVLAALQAPR